MSMVDPSIDTLMDNGKHNRYAVCLATAKCAREITDEYMRQKETAERLLANKDTDKSIVSLIKKEYRDEKAVRNAINRIVDGEFVIVGDGSETELPETAEKTEASAEEA